MLGYATGMPTPPSPPDFNDVERVLLKLANAAEREGYAFPRLAEYPSGEIPFSSPEGVRARAVLACFYLLEPAWDHLAHAEARAKRQAGGLPVGPTLDEGREKARKELRRAIQCLDNAAAYVLEDEERIRQQSAAIKEEFWGEPELPPLAESLAKAKLVLQALLYEGLGVPPEAVEVPGRAKTGARTKGSGRPRRRGSEADASSDEITDLRSIHIEPDVLRTGARPVHIRTAAEWDAALDTATQILDSGGFSVSEIGELLTGASSDGGKLVTRRRLARAKRRKG